MALAQADAETQAQFFNEFYRLLKVLCKDRHETQIHYIADELDSNGREFAEILHGSAQGAVRARAETENKISDLYRQKGELEREIEHLKEAIDGGV